MLHVGELWHFAFSYNPPFLCRARAPALPWQFSSRFLRLVQDTRVCVMSRKLITLPLFYQPVFSSVCQTLLRVCRHLRQKTLRHARARTHARTLCPNKRRRLRNEMRVEASVHPVIAFYLCDSASPFLHLLSNSRSDHLLYCLEENIF